MIAKLEFFFEISGFFFCFLKFCFLKIYKMFYFLFFEVEKIPDIKSEIPEMFFVFHKNNTNMVQPT